MLLRIATSIGLTAVLAGCPQGGEMAAEAPRAPLPPATVDASHDPLREPAEIHLRNVRQLSFGTRALAPRFSADGRAVAFETLPVGADGGVPVPKRVDLASGGDLSAIAAPAPPPGWPLSQAGPCVQSSRGDWACPLAAPAGSKLWIWPAGARAPHPLDSGPGVDASPAFSPDGQKLAWASTRGATRAEPPAPAASRIELLPALLYEAAAPRIKAIGPDARANRQPSWFPGGAQLVFTSNADDAAGLDFDVFRIDADGEDLERITFAPGADVAPAVSPDGHQLAWVSERNAAAPGEQDLFVADWVE